jgi:CBS domain containing-hemolysin-like protein
MSEDNSGSEPKSIFSKISGAFKKITKPKQQSLEQSVSEIIKDRHQEASLHTEEKNILQNIITFRDLDASDVMVPRGNITAVSIEVKLDSLKETFAKLGHTRVPVYKGSIDEIIGFIHVKDVFKCLVKRKKATIKSLIRDLIFVPGSIKLTDLLAKMKQSKVHVAIVLDEHGGTDGLVTIEDIIEEVVGDIVDEHDMEMSNYIVFDGETFVIDAKAEIEDVEKELGIRLSDDNSEFDTFGGMIIAHLGYIPKKDQVVEHPAGLEITVVDADHRRIKSTKVKFSDNIKIG